MNTPRGYLQVDRKISAEEAQRLREQWNRLVSLGQPPVLSDGVRFVPFDTTSTHFDPAIVQCGYCAQWGARQTQCRTCGAPIF